MAACRSSDSSTIFADHLDAGLVVPLDDAVHLFAVLQHDHHGRPRLHLLLIIEILRVGLLRRSRLPSPTASWRGTVPTIVSTVLPTVLPAVLPAVLRTLLRTAPDGRGARAAPPPACGVKLWFELWLPWCDPHAAMPGRSQLAICKIFLVRCRLTGGGIHGFFHWRSCPRARANHNVKSPLRVINEGGEILTTVPQESPHDNDSPCPYRTLHYEICQILHTLETP